jgi:hypothetical protein
LLAVAITAAACSDDDAADPTTVVTESTVRPETREPATTTSTTEATTTSSSTTTTTSPPPTTQSVDQLKAEIEAAYRDLDAKGYALLQNPTLDGLDAKVAEVAVPGGAYAQALNDRVSKLVQNGQYVVPDDPSLDAVTIESIEITGQGSATVTACLVTNALTVKRADQSPIPGRSIPIANPEVYASRVHETLLRTEAGWRHDGFATDEDPVWQGVDACPAE